MTPRGTLLKVNILFADQRLDLNKLGPNDNDTVRGQIVGKKYCYHCINCLFKCVGIVSHLPVHEVQLPPGIVSNTCIYHYANNSDHQLHALVSETEVLKCK